MSELQLFSDSETFTKNRPDDLTGLQAYEFFKRMAEEIIANGWSDSDADEIVADLQGVILNATGFELAKDLEYADADYEFTADFIQWLEDLEFEKRRAIEKNVRQWVKAHNPQPKYEKGQALEIKEFVNHSLKTGQTIFITGIREETAQYTVWAEKDHKGGYILSYEEVEAKCSPIT